MELGKEKFISWWDIAHGIGQVAVELFTKQFLHEGISEHGHGVDKESRPELQDGDT